MLTFTTYFIIVFILLLLNSIPVFGQSRTRRFAKIPSLIFFLLVVTFFVFRIIGFLTPDMTFDEMKQNDMSYDIKKRRGKIFTKPEEYKKDALAFESRSAVDSEQKKHYKNSSYILKFATVQALFIVLLSFLGKKKYEHRAPYYLSKIRVFSVLFILCLLLDLFAV